MVCRRGSSAVLPAADVDDGGGIRRRAAQQNAPAPCPSHDHRAARLPGTQPSTYQPHSPILPGAIGLVSPRSDEPSRQQVGYHFTVPTTRPHTAEQPHRRQPRNPIPPADITQPPSLGEPGFQLASCCLAVPVAPPHTTKQARKGQSHNLTRRRSGWSTCDAHHTASATPSNASGTAPCCTSTNRRARGAPEAEGRAGAPARGDPGGEAGPAEGAEEGEERRGRRARCVRQRCC
mmetsp:Transcript_122397/g.347052  ORF Transcript_122397/g.347052 Transcript_122397/m.347052 type:complete len:234 (+) Transcript_122397:163-864(+)